jgi:hypothetical protein
VITLEVYTDITEARKLEADNVTGKSKGQPWPELIMPFLKVFHMQEILSTVTIVAMGNPYGNRDQVYEKATTPLRIFGEDWYSD